MKNSNNFLVTIIKYAAVALLALTLFAACKKDKAANNSIEGVYEGKWGNGMEEPIHHYKLKIKPGGQLERLNEANEVIANGSWNLDGIEVTGYYVFISNGDKFSFSGLYTDFDGAITGTWGVGNSKANGGTFDIIKK